MDKLCKIVYNNPDLLYYYKNLVGTPPLQMVDDVLAIQTCSDKSLIINKTINTFIDLNNIILEEHHGSLKDHSTLTALSIINNKLVSNYSYDKVITIIQTDLSAAFDNN